MAELSLRRIRKSYGAVEVLKGVDIEVRDGEFIALVGPSGCGKSTLLAMIAGLETVTSGEIRIGGRLVNSVQPKDRDIAMVFQSYALYPTMTVRENITFGMESRGVPKAQQDAAVARVAGLLQIEPLLGRKPGQLSGGQRQRVAMGRALVRDPSLFLFDEPLSNLDAKLRVDMRTEIKRLHHRIKTSIVYVTHDQIEAMTLATKIAVLKDGILQQAGTPAEIYNAPNNMFVADFMGSPAMNLLPATVMEAQSGLALALEQRQGEPVVIPLADKRLASFTGQKVVFGIRPEAITDPEGADRLSRHIVEADCLIEVVEPAGADTYAITHLGGKEAVMRLRADAKVQPGQKVRLAFNLDKAVFFNPATEARIA
jgi:multiple sugar transport system ATP-binding protein